MKIFLIGMPGSGKSTVGKLLGQKLAVPFIDLDVEIEKREGRLVKEIFGTSGEDYFREVEAKILRDFAASSGSFVLATGGGAPCFHDGIKIINESGLSVFLNVAVDELVSRVEKEKDRPLLLSSDKLELVEKLTTIRNNRLKYYQQAEITVSDSIVDLVDNAIRLKM